VRYVIFSFGNGTLILFLDNMYCEDTCLKDALRELFWIAFDKNTSIECSWNPEFNWLPKDWELEFVDNFFDLLYSNFPSR
jgi:hypothetical protein